MLHFIIHLLPHPECNFPKCQFPQLQDISGIKEIVECCLYLLLGIYLASFQTFHQLLGGEIDIHHLVGLTEHAVGDAFLHIYTHHLAHLIVQALDVLDVDCRNHVDTSFEQFHHVLPSFGVAAAFHIGVGKLIDNHYFRMHLQYGVKVHLLNLLTLVKHSLARDDRQSFQSLHRVEPAMGLHKSYLHVCALPEHLAGILKHTVGLAHSGNHSYIYLKPSTVRPPYQVKEMICVIFHLYNVLYITIPRIALNPYLNLIILTSMYANKAPKNQL